MVDVKRGKENTAGYFFENKKTFDVSDHKLIEKCRDDLINEILHLNNGVKIPIGTLERSVTKVKSFGTSAGLTFKTKKRNCALEALKVAMCMYDDIKKKSRR